MRILGLGTFWSGSSFDYFQNIRLSRRIRATITNQSELELSYWKFNEIIDINSKETQLLGK